MIIESISIRSFGKLNNLCLSFHEKLNVIEGKNESGKSTIAAFIKYMLYGLPTQDRRKFLNWESGVADGSMTVRTDAGERYTINRRTTLSGTQGRETCRESASIIDLRDGSPVFAKQNAGDAILKLPEEIFSGVAFVGQFSDSKTAPDTSEAIENMLQSGNENINAQKALAKLELARRELLHKNGKGGEIYELSCKRDELCAKLSDACLQNEQIFEMQSRLSQTEKELSDTEAEIERLCSCVQTYDDILTAKDFSSLALCEKNLADKNAQRTALKEKNTYNSFCPDQDYLTALAVADSRRHTATEAKLHSGEERQRYKADLDSQSEHAEMTEKISRHSNTQELKGKVIQLYSDAKKHEKRSKTLLLVGVLSCIFIVGIFLLLSSSSAKKKSRALLSELSLIFSEFSVSDAESLFASLDKYAKDDQKYKSTQALLNESEARYRQALNSQKAADDEYAALLAKWGRSPDYDISELKTELISFRTELASIDAEIIKLEGECAMLKSKLSGKDEGALLSSIKATDTSILDFVRKNSIEKISELLAFYRSKQKALVTKERELREKYTTSRAHSAEPSKIKESLDKTQARLNTLQKRHSAYVLAYEAIQAAGEGLRSRLSPALSEYIKKAVSHITDGKYTQLGVDSSLELSCMHENQPHSPEAFSAGTRMAIYLSLRMALIHTLCKEKVPLCLDETLAYQDDERANALLSFIGKECGNMQCFLFTCHTREREMLKASDANIITL
jgi:DNA repair exonuclease SbcCD ATPase subunit